MRKLVIAFLDLFLIGLATAASFEIRDDFRWFSAEQGKFVYLSITLAVALVVNAAFQLNAGMWQYTNYRSAMRILIACAVTVATTTLAMFWIFRLEGVARSLPILQFVFMSITLIGSRGLWRHVIARRGRLRTMSEQDNKIGDVWTTLVVGVAPVAQIYLRAVAELGAGNVSIAGLLGSSKSEVGRTVDEHKVIGVIADLHEILRNLEVHGVFVNKVVVAVRYDTLTQDDIDILDSIEARDDIIVENFAEHFDFTRPAPRFAAHAAANPAQVGQRSAYMRCKRLIDVVVAGSILIVLSPVVLAVCLLVALTIGRPILFWQRRPGLNGKPFKIYKFRTLGASHDETGRKRDDEERVGTVGNLLRNTRLDEIPQLFNILMGDMSFVGPRPLLPVDQPAQFQARLDVRPGLTGWAQVNGGRFVSAEDKGAMDVWYVQNVSLKLDLEILCRTVPMVLRRERLNNEAIERAWKALPDARGSSSLSEPRLARARPEL